MHILVLFIWVASVIVLAIDAFMPAIKLQSLGLLLFDLWIGLQFLIETPDPVTI